MFHMIPPLIKGFHEDRGVPLAMGAVSTLMVVGFIMDQQRRYRSDGDPFGSENLEGRRARRRKLR